MHGDDKSDIISDRSPLTRPMPLTAWRIEIEQKAISSISQSFTANVIRPSLLYGGSGSLVGDVLFSSAKGGHIVWFGDENARMATIHKEDLGEAFRLCAEKVSVSTSGRFRASAEHVTVNNHQAYAIPGIIFDISECRSDLSPTYELPEPALPARVCYFDDEIPHIEAFMFPVPQATRTPNQQLLSYRN